MGNNLFEKASDGLGVWNEDARSWQLADSKEDLRHKWTMWCGEKFYGKPPHVWYYSSGDFWAAALKPGSILDEAKRLTSGDRNKAYGHPLDDYTKTAAMMSIVLGQKLKEPITPAEATLMMACVKISRQLHQPKRDNMVDLAGYAWCTQEILDEQERRKQKECLKPIS